MLAAIEAHKRMMAGARSESKIRRTTMAEAQMVVAAAVLKRLAPSPVVSLKEEGSAATKLRKAWKSIGIKIKLTGRSTFNPELLADQKREWTNMQREANVNKQALSDPEALLDHFVVVGLHPDTNVEEVEAAFAARKTSENAMPRGPRPRDGSGGAAHRSKEPAGPRLKPEVLFQFPPNKRLFMRDIQAFCFPSGVQARIMERTPSMSDFNEVLYGQGHARHDDQSFVFLLKVADNVTMYGVCVVTDEIVQRAPTLLAMGSHKKRAPAPLSRFLVQAPRCYCILTTLPLFDLHFEVLHSILAQQRLDRIKAYMVEENLSRRLAWERSLTDDGGENSWMASAIPVGSGLASNRPKTMDSAPADVRANVEEGHYASSVHEVDHADDDGEVSHIDDVDYHMNGSINEDKGMEPSTRENSDRRSNEGPGWYLDGDTWVQEKPMEGVEEHAGWGLDGAEHTEPSRASGGFGYCDNGEAEGDVLGNWRIGDSTHQGEHCVTMDDNATGTSDRDPDDGSQSGGEEVANEERQEWLMKGEERQESLSKGPKSRAVACGSSHEDERADTCDEGSTVSGDSSEDDLVDGDDDGVEGIKGWVEEHGNDALRIVCAYYEMGVPRRGSSISFKALNHLHPLTFTRKVPILDTWFNTIHQSQELDLREQPWDQKSPSQHTLESMAQENLLAAEEAHAIAPWTISALCRSLNLENILTILQAAMLEKQIVVFCPNLGVLSAVVLALIPMLRPFVWQSVLLPILPAEIHAFLDAPVPFLVGVQFKTPDVRSKVGQLLRVDISKSKVKVPFSQPPLPRHQELLDRLKPFHETLAAEVDAMKRPIHKTSDAQVKASQGFLAVLREFQQSMCANLQLHSITDVRPGGERVSLLLKDSFVTSFPAKERAFMKLFTETQMFAVHTDNVLLNYE